MRRTKDLALTAVFAALYAALVFALPGISFQLFQVRVADALIPSSIIFGWPTVIGVTVGCAVANMISPMPSVIVDVTLGSLANFIASFLAWKTGGWKGGVRIREFLGCLAATVVITLIVGTYLAILTGMPFEVWWISIFIGSVISISVLGYLLIQVLRKARVQVKKI